MRSRESNSSQIIHHEKTIIFDIEQEATELSRLRRVYMQDSQEILPCSFIPTQFISMDELADIWDKILFSEYSIFVKTGLKIVDANFDS